MRKSCLTAVALALPLAACVPETPAPLPDMTENCGAPALQYLLGQPASVLDTIPLAPATRILRPGMAVTMDYSPERLNIEIDAGEHIIRLSCG
ncbi:MAG: I78 family peptidase inhibitor [Pseudorhodobacter sp.]|nr:I78 family peptidase inhibitor [Pseudorhodobacter sp.]